MYAWIQTPTPDLTTSLGFYQKLGFQQLSDSELNLVSDGKVLVEINPDRYARASIKLFRANWETTFQELESLTTIQPIAGGYLFSDPSGTWVQLLTTIKETPTLPTNMSPVPGNYMGVSLEVIDMEGTIKIWSILGFKQTMGNPDQGWVTLADASGFSVSIMRANMCPHLFFNPSLTYFNSGGNLPIIQEIRDLKIPITEEITHFNQDGIVDNIIIRDPGGLGFFIFND